MVPYRTIPRYANKILFAYHPVGIDLDGPSPDKSLTKTTMLSSRPRCLFALLSGMTSLRAGECGYAPDKSPELPDGVRSTST
jgi:hypothetical protein